MIWFDWKRCWSIPHGVFSSQQLHRAPCCKVSSGLDIKTTKSKLYHFINGQNKNIWWYCWAAGWSSNEHCHLEHCWFLPQAKDIHVNWCLVLIGVTVSVWLFVSSMMNWWPAQGIPRLVPLFEKSNIIIVCIIISMDFLHNCLNVSSVIINHCMMLYPFQIVYYSSGYRAQQSFFWVPPPPAATFVFFSSIPCGSHR